MNTKETEYILKNTQNNKNYTVITEHKTIRNISHAKSSQFIATFSACLGPFCYGTALGWTSPASFMIKNGSYDFIVSNLQMGWASSLLLLGAVFLYIPTSYMLNHMGRKRTMLLLTVPLMLGWLLIIFAANLYMLYIGRFLIGMACGSLCIATPIYVAEISEKKIRGSLGCIFQLMISFGILFSFIIGSFVTLFNLSVICACLPIVFILLFIFQPESPVYLITKGRIDEAKTELKKVRSENADFDMEISDLIEIQENMTNFSVRKLLVTKSNRKALIICCGLMIFQQTCGITAILFYTYIIFTQSGSSIPSNVATIITGTVQALSGIISIPIVDKMGRRFLLILSSSGMSISLIVLGVFFHSPNIWPYFLVQVIPVLSLCSFTAFFSIGYGPVPWVILGEIFKIEIKTQAASIACFMNFLLCFIMTQSFYFFINGFGPDGTFWIFGTITGLGIFFLYFYVPETKGKTFAEIQSILNNS